MFCGVWRRWRRRYKHIVGHEDDAGCGVPVIGGGQHVQQEFDGDGAGHHAVEGSIRRLQYMADGDDGPAGAARKAAVRPLAVAAPLVHEGDVPGAVRPYGSATR